MNKKILALKLKGIKINKKYLFASQILVSFAFIYYALRNVNLQKIVEIFHQINVWYFLLFFFISLIFPFIFTYRWKLIGHLTNVKIKYVELLKIYLIGTFFANFFPGSLGGEIYRGYILSKRASSVSKSVLNIILEKGIALYSMLLTGVVVSFLYRSILPSYIPYFFFACSSFLTLVGVVIFKSRVIDYLIGIDFLKPFHSMLNELKNAVSVTLTSKKTALLIICITIINQLLQTFCTIFLYYAVSSYPNPWVMLAITLLIMVLLNIPVSVNGIGFSQGLFVYFAPLLGVLPETNLTVSLMLYFNGLLISGIGLVLYLSKRIKYSMA